MFIFAVLKRFLMADLSDSYAKAVAGGELSFAEAMALWNEAPLAELMAAADAVRRRMHPDGVVTWQIDRNVNITNVCVSGCKFCSFHCRLADRDRAYITSREEYRTKIGQMLALGGEQLLLQGGLHPRLGVEWYEELFGWLKSEFPNVKLHALGPPEIAHIARVSGFSAEAEGYRSVLERLMRAGLDSLPGAGAEILDNDIRRRISPGKCSADTWMEVMRVAHGLGLCTSATMMYGHVERPEHRILHLLKIRDLQSLRREGTPGFLAFIAWPYQGRGTVLEGEEGLSGGADAAEFLRVVAVSRLVLNNVPNIQASWLTTGLPAAQMALHGGANDMGSIMIEENVVSATDFAGRTTIDGARMREAIRGAGFTPRLRNQRYELL